MLNIGGILDHRSWAFPSELLRLPVAAAVVASWIPAGTWRAPAQVGLALAVLAFWLCLFAYRSQFDDAPQSPSRVIALPAPHADEPVHAGHS
jgi:hypothetical protein